MRGRYTDVCEIKGLSDTLFVWFTSLKKWPDPIVDPYFDFYHSATSEHDSIFIRDRSNSWFHLGSNGVGADLNEVIEFVGVAAKPYSRVVIVGSSMGGYAALLTGHKIGADMTVSIVPQTIIATNNKERLFEYRFEEEYARIVSETPTPEYLDLKPHLTSSTTTSVVIHGSSDIADVNHATRIAGCSGVVLLQIPNADHGGAALYSKNNGLLADVYKAGPCIKSLQTLASTRSLKCSVP